MAIKTTIKTWNFLKEQVKHFETIKRDKDGTVWLRRPKHLVSLSPKAIWERRKVKVLENTADLDLSFLNANEEYIIKDLLDKEIPLPFDGDFLTESEKQEATMLKKLIDDIVCARKKKGLSQRELARITGIRACQISKFERGEAMLQLNTLIYMCVALGVNLKIE